MAPQSTVLDTGGGEAAEPSLAPALVSPGRSHPQASTPAPLPLGPSPRAARALDKATSLEEFLEHREFAFLHYFAGVARFGLGEAVVQAARQHGLRAIHVSPDKARDGTDLLADEPYASHLEQAKVGEFDGGHSGWPCSSFSRLRFRAVPGMPGPVRDAQHLLGFPWNTPAQQAEAQRGTDGALRSISILTAIAESAISRGVDPVATGENPLPDGDPRMPSSFHLAPVLAFTSAAGVETGEFNTCIYGPPLWKPERWIGHLRGLSSLSGTCACTRPHIPIVGKAASSAAAEYPPALCEKYADLVAKAWLRRAHAEWAGRPTQALSDPAPQASDPAAPAPQGWDASQQPPMIRTGRWGNQLVPASAPAPEASWLSGATRRFGMGGPPNKRERREDENGRCWGGMRNPTSAVARLPALRALGESIGDAFDALTDEHPELLETGELLGAPYTGPSTTLVELWRHKLRSLVGAGCEPPSQFMLGRASPLQGELIQSWLSRGGDPETHMRNWIQSGVPLGIAKEIPCCGIFPSIECETEALHAPSVAQALDAGFRNYTSIYDNWEDARGEIERYLSEEFCIRMKATEAKSTFPHGSLSKLAIIIKEKADGSVKRRIIVDLRRSGANSKSKVRERIVLPRPGDVLAAARSMAGLEQTLWQSRLEANDRCELWDAEFVTTDFSDAYMHFRVHSSEWADCLAGDLSEDSVLMFIMLCFGLKAAPLIWGRFAAAVARLVQSLFRESEAQSQLYLDDPLLLLVGSQTRRTRNVSLAMLTYAALGISVAWHKSARGRLVAWIGISFDILWASQQLTLSVPEKMMKEVSEECEAILGLSMAGLNRLRSLTGRASWMAGVLVRARWAVSILYAVLASVDADRAAGVEAERRAKRWDHRDKAHLVPVKRVKLPLAFLLVLSSTCCHTARRTHSLKPLPAPWVVVVDASPWGLGMLLADRCSGMVLESAATSVDRDDEEALGITKGDCSAQGALECLAVLVAVKLWHRRFTEAPMQLHVRSDSVVALAMMARLASSSAAINFLGAELALELEMTCISEVVPLHIPGALNTCADYLSRLDAPGGPSGTAPPPLVHAKDRSARAALPRRREYYRLEPPGADASLWGGRCCSEAWAI